MEKCWCDSWCDWNCTTHSICTLSRIIDTEKVSLFPVSVYRFEKEILFSLSEWIPVLQWRSKLLLGYQSFLLQQQSNAIIPEWRKLICRQKPFIVCRIWWILLPVGYRRMLGIVLKCYFINTFCKILSFNNGNISNKICSNISFDYAHVIYISGVTCLSEKTSLRVLRL